MSAIFGIALADWQARTRTFAFAIVCAVALECAYLFVPDQQAGYVTVSIGHARGLYTAAWMGAMTALCSLVLFVFAGFYVVRGSVARDERLGTAEIVAASPVSRLAFVAGKWVSNVAILAFIGVVLMAGCMVMQQVRGESRAFDAAAYLLPFVLIVIPACAVIAAIAVLFDTVRPLRGVWGSVLWFLGGAFAFELPLGLWQAGRTTVLDPLGAVPLVAGMTAGARAVVSMLRISDVAIGITESTRLQTFVWSGMTWTAPVIASRVAWCVCAFVIVMLASRSFDRFSAARARKGRGVRMPIAALLPDIAGLRLMRAEIAILSNDTNVWLLVSAIALGVTSAFVPDSGLARVVLPLALLVPLPWYGAIAASSGAASIDEVIRSAPHAVERTIAARIAAAGVLGCIPLAGALVRLPALAIVPFAAAALAIVLGRIAGTPRAFEALYLAVWYVGVLNHLPGADVTADASASPGALAAAGLLTIAAGATGAWMLLRRG